MKNSYLVNDSVKIDESTSERKPSFTNGTVSTQREKQEKDSIRKPSVRKEGELWVFPGHFTQPMQVLRSPLDTLSSNTTCDNKVVQLAFVEMEGINMVAAKADSNPCAGHRTRPVAWIAPHF